MTVIMIGKKIDGGESTDKKTFDLTISWQVDDVFEYLDMIRRGPSKDCMFTCTGFHPNPDDIEQNKRTLGPHWVESCSFSRLGDPMANGKMQFEMKLKLRFIHGYEAGKENTPPWGLPINGWNVSGGTESVQLKELYLEDSNDAVPFVNSAGIPLEATKERGLSVITFTFNVEPESIDENVVWGFKNSTNANVIRINGREFPARSLLLDKFDISEEEWNPGTGTDDSDDLKVVYWKISVQMTFSPNTYNLDYLNVGTMIWSSCGLEKIYRWIGSDGNVYYTAYSAYLSAYYNGQTMNGADNGEEVTEPMFLQYPVAYGISPFDGYKQTETYLRGCPYTPMDWSYLQIPEVNGWREY